MNEVVRRGSHQSGFGLLYTYSVFAYEKVSCLENATDVLTQNRDEGFTAILHLAAARVGRPSNSVAS